MAAIRGRRVRKRHPLWLLTKKELRLQQLSFVVAGLYVLGWLGYLVWRGMRFPTCTRLSFLR